MLLHMMAIRFLDRSCVHINQLPLFSFFLVRLKAEGFQKLWKAAECHSASANSKQARKFLSLWLTLSSNLEQELSIGTNLGEKRRLVF